VDFVVWFQLSPFSFPGIRQKKVKRYEHDVQLNTALQHEVVHYTTTGIKLSAKRFATGEALPRESGWQSGSGGMQVRAYTTHCTPYYYNVHWCHQRRLSLAISTIGAPSLLVLDEPTAGMDPLNRREAWCMISRMKRGHTPYIHSYTHTPKYS
jgi:ABC-type glutathione transport system ATPase component